MTGYLDLIDDKFPVRNSEKQKEAFREWALEEAERDGIENAAEEVNSGHSQLVFGDLSSARVIFSAHYDTPRRALFPNLMLVSEPVMYWAYNIGVALVMLAAALGAVFAARSLLHLDRHIMAHRFVMLFIYMAVYFGLFFLLLRGPANRRNRNDNTSGTAAVLTLTRKLKSMNGVALVLFDDEEKGKKGSKAFAAAYPGIREGALNVNLDCVGNGDTFVFCSTKRAQDHSLFPALRAAAEKTGLPSMFLPAGKGEMNSDHKSFLFGVGVCACRHKPIVGWFTDRIHTSRDTVADPKNVEKLTDALAAFVNDIQ